MPSEEQQNVNNTDNNNNNNNNKHNNNNNNNNNNANVIDYKGNYPIYYLIHENRPAEEILQYIDNNSLTEKVLGSVDIKTGRTLLHTCCYRGDDIRTIRKLIKYAPKNVLVRDNRGGYPLHSFCFGLREDNHLDILYELMKAYPGAIKEKNTQWKPPIEPCMLEGFKGYNTGLVSI